MPLKNSLWILLNKPQLRLYKGTLLKALIGGLSPLLPWLVYGNRL